MELQLSAYRQLKYEERVKLAEMKQSQRSIGQIAEALNRSKSTISRELHRNQAPPGQYWPDTPQSLMLSRCERPCILDTHLPLREFVLTQLQCHYWTPEQIAGWLQHRQTELRSVCAETIYAWIYKAQQKKEKLWKFLPRHKAKRRLRKSTLAKSCLYS